jgi:peptidoglycan/xylan/chitin deacetylase (PgdA/CDA1 family)
MGAPPPTPLPSPQTVVSLTFDDADRTQQLASAPMRAHGMRGTFYVNSGPVDARNPQHMTWAQIVRLRQQGNDIGGHTTDHVDLTDATLPDAARRQEVCQDRRRLQQLGMDPVSFAYPYGALSPSVEQLVASCGYLSGRAAGGVTDDVAAPETIPPGDPMGTRAQRSPDGPWTLAALQHAVVSAAENGGGWLQLQFHRICAPSDPQFATCMSGAAPVDVETFTAFVDWLESDAPDGTSVRTVRQVMTASR